MDKHHKQPSAPSDGAARAREGEHRKTVRLKIPTRLQARDTEESTLMRASSSLHEDYRILDKIGGGGMGVVYLAQDHRLGRYVAIKRLGDDDGEMHQLKERFFREARAIAALNHIHIVHLYSLGEDRDGPYIVMEFVPGPKASPNGSGPNPSYTLADRVHREGPFPLDAALDLIVKLCRAMVYAHGCDVVHRDLKPTNVLLDESREPKIVDFGLARIDDSAAEPLTLPGEKMLSLGYGAPEQEVDASLTDARADVYGMGALFYFCITGKNPRYFRPNDLPEVVRMPIVKALETERDKRWASIEAFMSALMLVKAPEDSKLSTAKTTWRCKWCDTVNPVVIRHCGECGWDGLAMCLECASELRFGVQYCGVCGADAKAYEAASRLRQELVQHNEECDFALVLQKEKQIATFNPKGLSGRRLIEQVHELGQQAGASLRRRSELGREIEREREKQNYERVHDYIVEYDALATDAAYEELGSTLDALTLERDRERLRGAFRAQQWDYVWRNGARLLEGIGKDDSVIATLTKKAGRYLVFKRVARISGIVLVVLFVYLLSAAPVYRLAGRTTAPLYRNVYGLARYFQLRTLFAWPLRGYAGIWKAEDMFDPLAAPAATPPAI